MKSLWFLTKKNIKLLLRSKASALIVIFAPLLIVLLLGLSYNNTSQLGLEIGIYSTSFTEEVNSFINLLQEQEYTIIKYESSPEECVSDIKQGLIHACLEVPTSFEIESNAPREIIFHVDPSRINLVWVIQENLKEKFDFKAQQISQQLTQTIISTLSSTKSQISEKASVLNSIKERSASASTSADSIKSTLATLDLTLPEKDYGNFSTTTVSSDIDSSLSKISNALEAVDDSNLNSSEKAEITSLLNNADTTLNKIKTDVTGNGTSSATSMIVSLRADLDSAKQKLLSASSTISTTTSTLESTASSLREAISALDSLQTTLNEIINSIDSVAVTDPSTITTPLITKIEPVAEEATYLNYSFPALLILVIMFGSLLLGTSLVMMEKNSPAFLRNFFLPIRKATFILSIYLTNLVLILVQILVILGASLLFLKESLPQFPMMALILFITASMFTFLGMVVGYLFDSEETGILASISLGSIMLFFSGVILPLESTPSLIREITSFNPFVISEHLLREILIFHSTIETYWVSLTILLAYSLILFIIILIIEYILHQTIVNRFLRHHHRAHIQKDKINKKDA